MNNTRYSRSRYLRAVKKEKRAVRILQLSIVAGLLFAWEAGTGLGLADAFIVSSPVRMFRMFLTMAGGDLARHVLYTVSETMAGFILGVALGFGAAVGLWFSPFANKVLSPYLVVLNSLPKVALGPVIIVWAGAGVSAVITMALAISLIVTIMELTHGFYSTDANMMITVQSFGAGKWECFKKVVMPYNVPVLFQSLKVNIGLCLVGVIAGEFLVSKAGLGYLIVYAGQVFKMDLVMMSVVLLGFIAFLMYSAVSAAEKLAIKIINHI